MALSFSSIRKERPQWGVRSGIVEITLDNSYPTGGWSVSASDLGIDGIDLLEIPAVTTTGHLLAWDKAAGKVKAFSDVATEMSSGASTLDGVKLYCRYIGR